MRKRLVFPWAALLAVVVVRPASAQPSGDDGRPSRGGPVRGAPPVGETAPAADPAPGEAAAAPAEEAPKKPDVVTVRGGKADALKRGATSGTVVTQKDIERAQAESGGEMLRRVAGLQVRQEDPMGLRLNLGVRGLSPVRSRLILVEEDDIPVVVSPYGEPELYYMTSIERVRRMEVVKGADVLRHGPQTVGAVVRLSTWDPTEEPGWYVAGTAGSRSYGEGLVRYANTHNDVGYVVQAFHKAGDGYRGMGFDVSDAFAKIRFSPGKSSQLRLKLGFHQESANTTYTGLTDSLYRQNKRADTVAPDDRFDIRRLEIGLAHDYFLAPRIALHTKLFAYEMNLGLRLQDFDRSRRPQFTYPRVADPTGLFFRQTTSLRDRVYDVAGASTELDARFGTAGIAHHVTAGTRVILDTSRRRLSSGGFPTAESGDLVTDDSTRIFGFSGWLSDELAMTDALVLTPAVRIEHSRSQLTTHRIADDAQAPHDVDLTGKATSTGVMPGLSLGVGSPSLLAFSSLYLGYSAPRISQAITPDGRDANLAAERSSNYELGVRGKVGKVLRAEADGFMVNFDNQLVSNNPLSGATSEFVNGGRTRHVGFETTATAHLHHLVKLPVELDLSGQYTFVRSRFVGGSFAGHAIPYAPANTVQLLLDGAHASGLGGQVAFGYVGAQYTNEQNSIEGGPTGLDGRIDPYTTLDLSGRYRHERSGLGVSLAAKNVLDRVYISDRLPNGIFTAGFRQIFATVSWTTPSGKQ
jgi:Fe(3+) dicitrate transport protein